MSTSSSTLSSQGAILLEYMLSHVKFISFKGLFQFFCYLLMIVTNGLIIRIFDNDRLGIKNNLSLLGILKLASFISTNLELLSVMEQDITNC